MPIINPVLIGAGSDGTEVNRLKMQVEMLMEHYKYVYDLYTELTNQKEGVGERKSQIDEKKN